MTAASSIQTLLAPTAISAAGRGVASPAEAPPDTSFEALLREVQADRNTGTDEADAARTIAAAPSPVPTPVVETGTNPITPVQVPPPEALSPSLPAGPSTDQPPAQVTIPGYIPLVTPTTVSAAPTSTAQLGSMPATTAAAVQAQALAAQGETALGAAPASSQATSTDAPPASPVSGEVPVTGFAGNNAIGDGQLAQLAALAGAPGKAPSSEMPKSSKHTSSAATAADGVKALSEQPIQATAAQPQAQAAVPGSAGGPTNDPLQQASPASPDARRGGEAQAGTTPPATATNFAVELRHATQAPHGATPTMHVPLEALAVNIARRVEQGLNQFEISLTPAELGKLDISLKIGDDGRVHAVLRAERQDTLDLLRQDARTLENQLRQAGLDVGSNALSFQLSQGQGHKYKMAMTDDRFGQAKNLDERSADVVATTFVASRRSDGVDIHV